MTRTATSKVNALAEQIYDLSKNGNHNVLREIARGITDTTSSLGHTQQRGVLCGTQEAFQFSLRAIAANLDLTVPPTSEGIRDWISGNTAFDTQFVAFKSMKKALGSQRSGERTTDMLTSFLGEGATDSLQSFRIAANQFSLDSALAHLHHVEQSWTGAQLGEEEKRAWALVVCEVARQYKYLSACYPEGSSENLSYASLEYEYAERAQEMMQKTEYDYRDHKTVEMTYLSTRSRYEKVAFVTNIIVGLAPDEERLMQLGENFPKSDLQGMVLKAETIYAVLTQALWETHPALWSTEEQKLTGVALDYIAKASQWAKNGDCEFLLSEHKLQETREALDILDQRPLSNV